VLNFAANATGLGQKQVTLPQDANIHILATVSGTSILYALQRDLEITTPAAIQEILV
jgi:hypothetical protein